MFLRLPILKSPPSPRSSATSSLNSFESDSKEWSLLDSQPKSRQNSKGKFGEKLANPRSFRVALRDTAILASRIKQVARRRRPDTPHAVQVADFKGNPPLLEEHTVGVEQTELGVVNVRCLGSHSVELYNLDVPARHE